MTSLPFAGAFTLQNADSTCCSLSLYVVPTKWINSSVLSFPNQKKMKAADVDQAIKCGTFAPEPKDDWLKFACHIRKRFPSYDAAYKYVQENDVVESDSDDKLIAQLQRQQRIIEDKISVSKKQKRKNGKIRVNFYVFLLFHCGSIPLY